MVCMEKYFLWCLWYLFLVVITWIQSLLKLWNKVCSHLLEGIFVIELIFALFQHRNSIIKILFQVTHNVHRTTYLSSILEINLVMGNEIQKTFKKQDTKSSHFFNWKEKIRVLSISFNKSQKFNILNFWMAQLVYFNYIKWNKK